MSARILNHRWIDWDEDTRELQMLCELNGKEVHMTALISKDILKETGEERIKQEVLNVLSDELKMERGSLIREKYYV